MRKYNVIDLFAGAGGLSNGFEQVGKYEVIAACEKNEKARETYLLNHDSNRYFEKDVREIDYLKVIQQINSKEFGNELKSITWDNYKEVIESVGAKKIDIIIGGPPCQGFSNANRQKNHLISSNNELVKEFIRVINEVKPIAFVMENVKGFASDKHKFFLSDSNLVEFEELRRSGETKSEKFHIDSLPVFLDVLRKDICSRSGFEEYILSKRSYTTLNVLYKVIDNREKLKKEIERKAFDIEKLKSELQEWLCDSPNTFYGLELRRQIKQFIELENMFDDRYISAISDLVITQRLFNKLQELIEHKIIVKSDHIDVQPYEVIVMAESATVIDYVTHVLKTRYTLGKGVLKAVEFGVPQIRERFIMMGVRRDIIDEKELPMPKARNCMPVTVDQAICDLKDVEPSTDIQDHLRKVNGKKNDYLSLMHSKKRHPGYVSNHINTDTGEIAKERYNALEEGGNFHSLDDKLKTTYAQPERTQSSIYLKLKANRPSSTVTNVRKSMWVNPYMPRALSIREAARLQSFNDDFIFMGTKDAQYQQVGNAVPPLLAKAIGEHLSELIEKSEETQETQVK